MRRELLSPHRSLYCRALPLAMAILAGLLAGCDDLNVASSTPAPAPSQAPMKLPELEGAAQFQKEVLSSNLPVMVEFYKDPCPTCEIERAKLEELAGQYRGKVKFVRFKTANMTWENLCPEVHDRYKINAVPTTILFYQGHERHRWELLNFPSGSYRAGIDELLAEIARKTPAGK